MASANKDQSDLESWRKKAEERLKSDTGWLTVVALEWLKTGNNTVGSNKDQNIRLPESAPAKLGVIHLPDQPNREAMTLEFLSTDGVTFNGEKVEKARRYPLKTDDAEKPSEIKVGTVTFFPIKRKNGVGIRIKDTASALRRDFKHRIWFEAKPKFTVQAKWETLDKPMTLKVPDILGNINDEQAAGRAIFEINGTQCVLYAIKDDNELFFVFRDQTSGKETYGAGRFLYAALPKGAEVTLDFNKAVNPPCAFTPHATCPIPPVENRLSVAIQAGEKAPPGHH